MSALRFLFIMDPLEKVDVDHDTTFAFMLVVDAVLLPVVALFFHLEPDVTLGFVALFSLLAAFGFSAAGSLFAALTVQTRARDLMLSVVVFPLLLPALLAGVLGAREALAGAPLAEVSDWLLILGATDLLFLAAGVMLFELLLSD